MEPPGLKLIMVQGPRSGETLEFKPGSTVRIGRIIRGNNLTIKDAGISSKHLIIESELGKWTVQDLGSSNGTTLNSAKLPPNTPLDLNENDTIKLGECTSILVQMMMGGQDDSVVKTRRNPRRQANVAATASVRVTRSRKNAECVENLELDCGVEENQSKIAKKGKGWRKNLQEMPQHCEVQIEGKENLNAECVENQRITKKGRGRRKKLQEMLQQCSEVQIEDKKNVEQRVEPPKNCEVQIEGEKKLELREEPPKNCEVQVEGKENLELGEEPPKNCEVQVEGKEILEPGKVPLKNCGVQVKDQEKRKSGKMPQERCGIEIDGKENLRSEEVAEGDVEESCNKDEDIVESGVQDKGPDLDRMTLGEWFDYMEVYLPKQIIEATEEMIEGMRKKAERVHEYMIEQKKG